MAKIGDLEVEDIKIKDGALTTFYSATGSSGATQAVTVTIASPNPLQVFVWAAATGTVTVTRTRDSKVIGQFTPVGGIVRDICVDVSPEDGDVYTLSGITSGSYREITAVVRLA